MSNLTITVSDTRKKIYELLESFGIQTRILIDNDAEETVLNALTATDIESVVVDHEGALVINYTGNEK